MNKSKGKNKDKSVKFLLAPRPQRDPLAADFEAPQNVLIPKGGLDVDQVKDRLPDFDSSLFTSKDETRVGMLERAYRADGMTFDKDVLQAMSKDFDFENPNNILDDDFIDQAGGLIEDEGELLNDEVSDLTKELFEDEPEVIPLGPEDGMDDEDDGQSTDSDNYDLDEFVRDTNEQSTDEAFGQGRRLILFKKKSTKKGIESDREKTNFQDNDDNKSVFTNYSMTSSVMRRSQGLQQIDEHFERLFEKEYADDDTEIDVLDEGNDPEEDVLADCEKIRAMKKEVKIARKKDFGADYEPEIVSEHYKTAVIGDEPAAEDEDLVEIEFRQRENRVDCESILSYNSNLYNHPKLIVEPRKRKTSSQNSTNNQMDVDDLDQRSRSEVSQSIASTRATILSKLSIRPSNETPEERKARKKALKIYRQERRKERKQNHQIFKAEKANVTRQQRTNVPALRLA